MLSQLLQKLLGVRKISEQETQELVRSIYVESLVESLPPRPDSQVDYWINSMVAHVH